MAKREAGTVTNITKSPDCGNSPKNQLLQNLVIALACADFATIHRLVAEDVCWLPAGKQPVSGVAAVCKAITRHGLASRLVIEHVVSHGKAGSVNGVVEFGGKARAFCHVFEFSSAKGTAVSCITTYSVALG